MMTRKTKIKICGIKDPDAMMAALESGADFVGLNFHPESPRYVDIEVAAYLASYVPKSVSIAGLFVDPDDRRLDEILTSVRLDIIQLHGRETPERVTSIKTIAGYPVMKALPVGQRDDLAQIELFAPVCDWLLLDAPGMGGGGKTFDWALLEGLKSPKPWMLAGGLTPENVAEAIQKLKPDAVDVSSGVESSRGVKDAGKIHAFIKAVKDQR